MFLDRFTQLEKQIQKNNARVIGNHRHHTELVAFPDLSTFNYLPILALNASFNQQQQQFIGIPIYRWYYLKKMTM